MGTHWQPRTNTAVHETNSQPCLSSIWFNSANNLLTVKACLHCHLGLSKSQPKDRKSLMLAQHSLQVRADCKTSKFTLLHSPAMSSLRPFLQLVCATRSIKLATIVEVMTHVLHTSKGQPTELDHPVNTSIELGAIAGS